MKTIRDYLQDYPFYELATACIARLNSRMALVAYMDVGEGREQDAEALQIVVIASYYASLRLPIRKLRRTLRTVQPLIPG